jgi:hypothetical protein
LASLTALVTLTDNLALLHGGLTIFAVTQSWLRTTNDPAALLGILLQSAAIVQVMLAFKQQLQFQFVERCCQNQIYFKCLLLPASLPKVLSLRAML